MANNPPYSLTNPGPGNSLGSPSHSAMHTETNRAIDDFTTDPALNPPGGTTNFYRADGTWAAPAGGIPNTCCETVENPINPWNLNGVLEHGDRVYLDKTNATGIVQVTLPPASGVTVGTKYYFINGRGVEKPFTFACAGADQISGNNASVSVDLWTGTWDYLHWIERVDETYWGHEWRLYQDWAIGTVKGEPYDGYYTGFLAGYGGTLSTAMARIDGNVVGSSDNTIDNVIALTQTAYDAIGTPDAKTLYVITGP